MSKGFAKNLRGAYNDTVPFRMFHVLFLEALCKISYSFSWAAASVPSAVI